MRLYLIILGVLSFLLFHGCNKAIFETPDCGISKAHINTEIHTGLMDEWNTYKIGDGTIVYITLEDQIQVKAPKDFNLKVFVFDSKNKKWNQVNNINPINLNGNETILNSGNKSTILPIDFDLEISNKSITVFYCVSGITGEKKLVGASGTFILYP